MIGSLHTGGGLRTAPSPEHVAWAAGLFEGEGCFHAAVRVRRSGTRTWAVQVRLAMTDGDVVRRFARIVECGHYFGARDKRPHEKPMHEWAAQDCLDVIRLCEMFLPYLGDRRRGKALEVLAAARQIRPHNVHATHCPQGHPLDGANLVRERTTRGAKTYLARRCKTCRRAQDRTRKAARAA